MTAIVRFVSGSTFFAPAMNSLAAGSSKMDMLLGSDDLPEDVSPMTAIIGSSTYWESEPEVNLSITRRKSALPARSSLKD